MNRLWSLKRRRLTQREPKWSKSDRIAGVALLVAILAFMYNPFRDYFYREPERRALSATVSAFDYAVQATDTALVAEVLLQNLGNRQEIVRSMNFVLPFDARGLLDGDFWYVPAGLRFNLDLVHGVGKCWPADTLGVIVNLHLAPGEIVLRQLRQRVSEARLVDFLRGNQSRMGADSQLIAVEFVVTDLAAGARTFIAPVASVSLNGDWKRHEWVRVDLSGPGADSGPARSLPGPRQKVTGEVEP